MNNTSTFILSSSCLNIWCKPSSLCKLQRPIPWAG